MSRALAGKGKAYITSKGYFLTHTVWINKQKHQGWLYDSKLMTFIILENLLTLAFLELLSEPESYVVWLEKMRSGKVKVKVKWINLSFLAMISMKVLFIMQMDTVVFVFIYH